MKGERYSAVDEGDKGYEAIVDTNAVRTLPVYNLERSTISR
ncbi:hypothetical protein QUB47_23815 [Microcoleus sp. AT9_B5]